MALRQRRCAEEASRGALKAVHASAGLARPHSSEAAALLRSAEGLVRAAVALLQVQTSVQASAGGGAKAGMPQASTTSASGPTQTSHPHGGGVSRASRRRRRRRMVDDSKCEGDVSAGDQTNALSVNASDQNLTVGNSVYFGDLSELGVGRNSDAVMGSASGPQAHAHSQASLPLLDVQSFQEWMDRRQLPPEAQQNLWQRLGYVVQEDPANGNIEITAITSQ